MGGIMGDMEILITGMAGQLGNRLSEILSNRGIKHRGLDRCREYKTDVPYLCKDLLEVDKDEFLDFIDPVTHVVHFADVINDSKNFDF